MVTRRRVLATDGAVMMAAVGPAAAAGAERSEMYGLIGSMKAQPGQRDALSAILLENAHPLPGCLSYVVAGDPSDPDTVWVTEVWDSADSHRASLGLPAVQDAIARAKPLLAGFGQRTETRPLGGHGLAPAT